MPVTGDRNYTEELQRAEKRFLELSEKLHINMKLLLNTLSENQHYIINDSDRDLYNKYFQTAFTDNFKKHIINMYLKQDQIAVYKKNYQLFHDMVMKKNLP